MLRVGEIVQDHYEIIRLLSYGGFGYVWLAHDQLADIEVAIKELINPKGEQIDAMLLEIRTIASLNLPGVVRFYTAIRQPEAGTCLLVMEYCSQGTLADLLRARGKLRHEEAVEILIHIGSTLHAVHEQGYVHHDLKPNNLLIDAQGKVKISDFGMTNQRGGTLAYLAPENFTSDNDPEDRRSDVYALGVILHELLTGRLPFEGDEEQLIAGHLFQQPTIPVEIPRWLEQVLRKAMEKPRELRFQTAMELVRALETRTPPPLLDQRLLDASIVNDSAQRLMRLKRWKAALNQLNQALLAAPYFEPAVSNSGECLLRLGQHEDAISALERARQLGAGLRVVKLLGQAWFEQGDLGKANGCLSDYLFRNPNDTEAMDLLAFCLLRSQHIESCRDLFQAVLARTGMTPPLAANLLACYLLLADQEALNEHEKRCQGIETGPFWSFNFKVFHGETSWSGTSLRGSASKVLFQSLNEAVQTAAHEEPHVTPLLDLEEPLDEGMEPEQTPRAGLGLPITISLDEGEQELSFAPDQRIVSFGRLSVNDIHLNSHYVSRRHCALVRHSAEVYLYNLGSALGTHVKRQADKQFRRVTHRALLSEGTWVLEIGDVTLKVIIGERSLL